VAPSGNAAVQRLASGDGPPAAGPGALAAAGSAALHRWHAGRSLVQAKWTVSRPGDPLEREADAVAARFASGSVPEAPGTAAASSVSRVERLPAAGGAVPPGDPAGAAAPPSVEAAIRNPGPGAPIPDHVRAPLESYLGVSLAEVPVHTSETARAAAADIGARAFTAGGHIFLGPGESAGDLPLMAHEATHVVQQQAVRIYRETLFRATDDFIPDFILDAVREYANDVPGYPMLTVAVGYDPIGDRDVPRTPENLVRGALSIVPFGNQIANRLLEMGVLQDAYRIIDGGLTAHNLTLARLQREIDQAWDELSVTEGIGGNLAIVTRHVDAVYQDALAFVRSIVDAIVQLVRDAAVDLAETFLVGTPVWDLAKKVLHHDPLRGTPVEASTVEILTDFLKLIGQEQRLAQMQERGTLQKTADWLDLQVPRFLSLISELGVLFRAGWEAIQPQNLANLPANLQALARDAVGLVQRVGAFATDVIATVLRLVKDALLGWLSEHAHHLHGFRLLTVVLGRNPFTGESVPRTAENLIGGFIALMPGGEATYAQLAESGVIAQAGAQIEGAIGRLGISWDLIVNTFRGVWDSLTLDDLLAPVAAFERILARFGEPLGRIVQFVGEVVKVVITLILQLMNFPSDLVGSILGNAMSAIDDITNDPVGFLVNMMQALKSGLSAFFDKILSYLLQGLTDWLFRGLGGLGIQRPADLSLESILGMVLQVLGITAETLWQKLGQQIGAENVARVRGAVDTLTGAWGFVKDVQERGLVAIWEHVSDQLGNLWDTLIGMARDWIVTEIVEKVTTRLLSMLDPTGVMAVVNSFVAFFNAIQSAIEYLRDILQIVDRYVSTLAAVAKGNIQPGAQMLEQGLAQAVPVAIGFLANQVGIGNVPEKVVEIIGGLRQLVDQALDWLFEQAMRLGQAALTALRGGTGAADPNAPPAAGVQQDPNAHPVPGGPLTPAELDLHMALVRAAVGRLQQPTPGPYRQVRARKEQDARTLETEAQPQLRPGIRLSVLFPEQTDRTVAPKIHFQVRVAPNTTEADGDIPLGGSGSAPPQVEPPQDFYHGSDKGTAERLAGGVRVDARGGGEFGAGFYTFAAQAPAERAAEQYTRNRGGFTEWGVVEFSIPVAALQAAGLLESILGLSGSESVLVFPDRRTSVDVRYPDDIAPDVTRSMSWEEFRDENRRLGGHVSWPYDLIIGPLSGTIQGHRNVNQFSFNDQGLTALNDRRVRRALVAEGSV
jgi:hypothetical protein